MEYNLLPAQNADARPVIPMSEEQRYIFDLKGCPPTEVIASMPSLRQSLFRGAWHGMTEVPNINKYYDEANQAV
jgi:hypothetical protein